jgi:hypothetical protein
VVEIKKNFDNSQIVKNADYDSDDEDDLNEAQYNQIKFK